MNKLFIGQYLAASMLLAESSGPVRVKEQYAESAADIIRREREESRERSRLRVERDNAEAAIRHARTTAAEWAKIERAEQRRADKKAQKKAIKLHRLANK